MTFGSELLLLTTQCKAVSFDESISRRTSQARTYGTSTRLISG